MSRILSGCRLVIFLFALCILHCNCSWAENPAIWDFSVGTSGENISWTSPTAVDLGFPRYAAFFDLTRVEAFTFLGGTDVTDQFDLGEGVGVFDTLPITLVDEVLSDPSSGTTADIEIGIDSNGFGQVIVTDVELGSILFIQIERIEVDATIEVRGVVPGDFDGDLKVDEIDLALWETAYGVNANADTDFNGVSDGFDFLEWQQYKGSDYNPALVAFAAVPEPASMVSALLTMILLCTARRKSA